MKTTIKVTSIRSAALLAAFAGAEVIAWSEEMPLDTRSLSIVTDVEEQDLDTRSHTTDGSAARKLNTKTIIGTAIVIR